jgi:hypothetical protein
MDAKRAIGGFCTFVGGAVVNIIQATQPNWFGNHAWILPASSVVLFVGLLVWLCQYRWVQKLLGIVQSPPVPPVAPHAPVSKPPNRLKIIEAHYGIEGINDPDVTHYLLERQHGDYFAEPIGADLFGGFDPVAGAPKRLKVRYALDGREATIERPEYNWMILPEDLFLKKQIDDLVHQLKVDRNQYNSDLSRAKEFYEQCKAEKKELTAKLEGLTPLQIEAFSIARDLRDFRAGLEPFPKRPIQRPGESDYDFMVRHISERHRMEADWGQRVLHAYVNRGFGPKITSLLHRVGEELNYPIQNPAYAEDIKMTENAIPKLAQEMDMLAIWINRQQRNEADLLDDATTQKRT